MPATQEKKTVKPGTLVRCADDLDCHHYSLAIVLCYIPDHNTYRIYVNGQISSGRRARCLEVVNE